MIKSSRFESLVVLLFLALFNEGQLDARAVSTLESISSSLLVLCSEMPTERVLLHLGRRERRKRWEEMGWVWAESGSLVHHFHMWWIESVQRVLNHFEWPVLSVSEADDSSLTPPKHSPVPNFMAAMSLSKRYEVALGCPSWWSLPSSYAPQAAFLFTP